MASTDAAVRDDRREERSRSRTRRSRSRSRSRSPPRRRRSPSPSPKRRASPPRSFARREALRENPEPSKVLGVFGLSLRTTEDDLKEIFSKHGEIEKCTVVMDRRNSESRGFAFINFSSVDEATAARDALNSTDIDGRRIRVDFSVTLKPHDPTPGAYAGRPTQRYDDRDRDRYRRDDRRRSPPRSYRRRSRSRSRSPRRRRRSHSRSRSR